MDAKNFALTSSARPFNRVERLNRGGRLILYSGTPIIGSADRIAAIGLTATKGG